MSLTRLFNFNFLKENIKKSKGIIILFSSIVPLFTAIFTIFFMNKIGDARIASFTEITWPNLVGMYIIPFAFSFSLFGYVYKRKSVDFINSMPINRKSLFITNTIGGLVLIFIMQLITALILLLCSAFCSNLYIFPKMVLDIFIAMFVSYSFVFIASNLAMSFSGTYFTQIAVTLLILFLIPFCVDGFRNFDYYNNAKIVNEQQSSLDLTFSENDMIYTTPYGIFSYLISDCKFENFLIGRGFTRTIILSVVYFIIGLILFQKRKMENTEESFSTVKMHEFVKALTMLPMFILLNLVEFNIDIYLLVLSLILIYFFLYNYIVKRKVKILISILSFVIISVSLQGICSISKEIKKNIKIKEYSVNDIESVAFIKYYEYSNFEKGDEKYISSRALENYSSYYFEDKEIIKFLIDSAIKVNNYEKEIYYGNSFDLLTSETIEETADVVDLTNISPLVKSIDLERVGINLNVKLKNGKKYRTSISVYKKDLLNLFEMLKKDEGFLKYIENDSKQNAIIEVGSILCNRENSKKVLDDFKKISPEDLLSSDYSNRCFITVTHYKNNKLISKEIPVNISSEILKTSSDMLNAQAKELVKKYSDENAMYDIINDNALYSFYYNEKEAKDFLKNEILNSNFDYTKPYKIINGRLRKYTIDIYYFTNSVNEINELMRKEDEDRKLEIDNNYYDKYYYTRATDDIMEDIPLEENTVYNY